MNANLVVPLVAPIIALILGLIVGYALKRYHVARILYADVDYRLRFETLAVYRLMKQFKKLQDWSKDRPLTDPPPFIRMVKEKHFIFPSIQDDLKSCLWGREVDAVHNFYRDFQLIEHRAGKIEGLYSDLVKKYVECSAPDPPSPPNYPKCYVEQIEDLFNINKGLVEFWLGTLWDQGFKFGSTPNPDYKFERELAFPGAAINLLYRRLVWYPTFVVIPLFAIAGAFSVVFFIVFRNTLGLPNFITEHLWLSVGVAVVTITLAIFVAFGLKYLGDRKIKESVLIDFGKRLHETLNS